jgi:hypothetical protein
MSFVLYAATAAALLWLAHRYVTPIGRTAAIILFFLPFVFVGKALLLGRVYAPVDIPYVTEPLSYMRGPLGVDWIQNGILSDLFTQMIPWRKSVQFALAHHEWPLWNPFILSGSLLAATAQPAVYSPFTLLACLLPVADSLTFTAAINLFIAALSAYLFASEIGCRASAALCGAAAFMCCTAIAFFILWAIGGSWTFLPLVLLGTRRCVRQPGVRSAVLLTVALTLLLLAGHPETALHAVFVGAIYGVFELARQRAHILPAIASAAAAGILALMLSAIYVLPIIDAAPDSGEYQFRKFTWAKQPHGVVLPQAAVRIVSDFFPFLSGQRWKAAEIGTVPLDTTAAGSIVLALAIYACIRVRRAETWFFAGLFVFGILARAGWAPLANALQRLPLLDVTINERFSFAGAFALTVLMAIGVEEILRRGGDRMLLVTACIVLIVITAGTLYLRGSGMIVLRLFPEWSWYAIFGEIGGLAIAGLAIALFHRRPQFAYVVLLALLLQRFLTVGDIYPTLRREVAYPPIPILEPLKKIHEPFRIVAQHHGFIPGTSALYELEDVRGYEALTFARYAFTYPLWCVYQPVWFNRVDDLTRPFLSVLNVRYAVTTAPSPPPGWHEVARQRGTALFENDRVLPRAFIPPHAIVGRAATADTTLEAMQKETDFSQRAWIDAPMPLHEENNAAGTVAIERQKNGFKFRVSMTAPGWMIVSEPAWKGWRAYIDGRRVRMQYADIAFLGIWVPAGNHTVRLVYLPDAFVTGRAISFATLVALVLAGLLKRFQPFLQRRDRGVAPLLLRQ